ncbi:hypothetical protein SERLA73DRAFT_148897 [Serpula lacrymans var. lacrymans S7.3]|uniref:Helitron helicase-like domain-containing protein n=1 Tax=Serpula lacrymans var. lacrymans (strain S7.3) TaxID=936435 RepID=F8PGK4_SERL3|nr:hypothetical protein SERLA73DRAFT_148897 [Serpula lacrymans var. lacrymans S7.3]
MPEIQDTLEQSNPFNPFNPFILLYKQAYQIIMEKPEAESTNITAHIALDQTLDQSCYNLPTADDVAAVIPGDGEHNVDEDCDIVLQLKQFDHGGGLKHISYLYPLYSPLHYVLLFPFGEQGWHRTLQSIQNADGNICSEYVSQPCYYAYHLHSQRTNQSNHFYGKLLWEYCVDAWASTEESELNSMQGFDTKETIPAHISKIFFIPWWIKNSFRKELYDQLVAAKKHKKDRCKQAKKDAADAKVAAAVPRLEVAAIPKTTVAWVPPNSEIGMLKAGNVKALEATIKCYNSGKACPCTRVACEVVEESGTIDLASESGDSSVQLRTSGKCLATC